MPGQAPSTSADPRRRRRCPVADLGARPGAVRVRDCPAGGEVEHRSCAGQPSPDTGQGKSITMMVASAVKCATYGASRPRAHQAQQRSHPPAITAPMTPVGVPTMCRTPKATACTTIGPVTPSSAVCPPPEDHLPHGCGQQQEAGAGGHQQPPAATEDDPPGWRLGLRQPAVEQALPRQQGRGGQHHGQRQQPRQFGSGNTSSHSGGPPLIAWRPAGQPPRHQHRHGAR